MHMGGGMEIQCHATLLNSNCFAQQRISLYISNFTTEAKGIDNALTTRSTISQLNTAHPRKNEKHLPVIQLLFAKATFAKAAQLQSVS